MSCVDCAFQQMFGWRNGCQEQCIHLGGLRSEWEDWASRIQERELLGFCLLLCLESKTVSEIAQVQFVKLISPCQRHNSDRRRQAKSSWDENYGPSNDGPVAHVTIGTEKSGSQEVTKAMA